ncbi:MAG TPA: pyridoxamine 5'-phosphate oxidase, partial [Gammaproteobacteria bacterium]|nr:pyridoxamine 5'-phosphate oxidase [Gammaproteobacteria bacterium]
MSEQFAQLESKHIQFIGEQHIYFVGTAGAEGYVNVSPKGMDSLRVISPDRVIWLNLTGSGNETAAHVLENGRMTLMFCSFEKQPLILRLYGVAEAIHSHEENWSEWIGHFPVQPGARQIFNLQI